MLTEDEIDAALDEYLDGHLDGHPLEGTLWIVNGEELVLFPRGEPVYDDGGLREYLAEVAAR